MKIAVAFLLLVFAVPAFGKDHHATFAKSCTSLSQKWLNETGWKNFTLNQPNPKNAGLLQVAQHPSRTAQIFGSFAPASEREHTEYGTLSLAGKGSSCTVTNHGGAAKAYLGARAHQAHVKVH